MTLFVAFEFSKGQTRLRGRGIAFMAAECDRHGDM